MRKRDELEEEKDISLKPEGKKALSEELDINLNPKEKDIHLNPE